LAKQDKEE